MTQTYAKNQIIVTKRTDAVGGGLSAGNTAKNDVITFCVDAEVANHCGVFLGNDVFYHHAVNRLSCRENLYPFWVKYIHKVYRYVA